MKVSLKLRADAALTPIYANSNSLCYTQTVAIFLYIFNRNDKSEHITYLDNIVRIIITWSECNYGIYGNPVISMVCKQQARLLSYCKTSTLKKYRTNLFLSGISLKQGCGSPLPVL